MERLEGLYRLKERAKAPYRYLGANIDKVQLKDGSLACSMSSQEYLRNVIKNLEEELDKEGKPPLRTYGKKAGDRPFPLNYRPEIDVSPELGETLQTRVLQLIGILRWSIELGRIDIITEVSVLSQHQYRPRVGHLKAAYRIFWFLKCALQKGKEARIIFDPSEPYVDEKLFNPAPPGFWDDFYPDAEEAIPMSIRKPRGKRMKMGSYVDAEHAGNLMTRRSHSGLLLYLQNTLVLWYSKRQNTVESSIFGSEFIALQMAVKMIEALCYKLRSFGVPIEGPTDIFCDNKSFVTNSTVSTSILNSKHNAICYHRVREAQTTGTVQVGWISGKYNKADLATKTTLSTKMRHDLVSSIFDDCHVVMKDGDPR